MSTAPPDLLRVYEETELGPDGYPVAWHQETAQINWAGPKIASHYEESVSPAIKHYVREQAGHRCLRCGHPYPPGITGMCPRGEWTPCDEHCTHGGPFRFTDERVPGGIRYASSADSYAWLLDDANVEAHWRILTVHHLNENKADCRWWNLAALCQICHLSVQGRVNLAQVYPGEHSEWFKPYAAGYYASAYLHEELTREQVMERLDELLDMERQWA